MASEPIQPYFLAHVSSFSDNKEKEEMPWPVREYEEIMSAIQAEDPKFEQIQLENYYLGYKHELPGILQERENFILHLSGEAGDVGAVDLKELPYEQRMLREGAQYLEESGTDFWGYLLPKSDEPTEIMFASEMKEYLMALPIPANLVFLNFDFSDRMAVGLQGSCEYLIVCKSEIHADASLTFSQRFYFYLLRLNDIKAAFQAVQKDMEGLGLREKLDYELLQAGEIPDEKRTQKPRPKRKEAPREKQAKQKVEVPLEAPASETAEASEEEKPADGKIPPTSEDDPFLDTRLHADHWAEEDLLGYERYAYNIQQIIKRKRAKPPLTIGVIAPWGQGKTTLMRYVERSFEGATSRYEHQPDEKLNTQASKAQIEAWDKEDDYKKDRFPRYPCVWFNPWQYQSSEQIWAGMAHAIIHQLVDKLSPIKQEEFWFKLQSRRIDKQAIKRDAIRDAITQTIPGMVVFVVSAIISALLPLLIPDNAFIFLMSLGVPVSSIALTIRNSLKTYAESFREKYDKYLQSPDYEEKLGYFHEVNEDLQRVFDLLVEEDTPALIFIDDLDRCSPQKVVEVIEAINLMMNASFRRKCYFVLGMDAEMVAASIDVAYAKMQGSIPGKVNKFGSVGWYFLDKFIQLPFLIPTLSDEKKLNLVSKLFEEDSKQATEKESQTAKKKEEPPIEKARAMELQQKAKAIRQEPQSRSLDISNLPKVEIKTQAERRVFEESFLDLGFESQEEENEIQQRVGSFAQYLDPSPRSIKRFANLLRFHASLQNLRQATNKHLNIEGDDESYEEFADIDTLAFWLILTLRWPLLVRWLQWELEDKLDTDTASDDNLMFASHQTIEKAQMLDKIIGESIERAKQNPDPAKAFESMYQEWLELYQANKHLSWLKDKELIQLFFDKYSEKSRLERAFLCSVW